MHTFTQLEYELISEIDALKAENQRLRDALKECNRISKNIYTAGPEGCYLDCDEIEMISYDALEAQ